MLTILILTTISTTFIIKTFIQIIDATNKLRATFCGFHYNFINTFVHYHFYLTKSFCSVLDIKSLKYKYNIEK